jgi:heme oxygenase
MKKVLHQVETAQQIFRERMHDMKATGGLTQERYCRFLSMQYHLTRGVQRHFMAIAANPLTAKKKGLRKFLIGFAQEEEFHYEIAKADLKNLGQEPKEIPFDTYLWWKYFDSVIETQPFIRLGATTILENISDGAGPQLDEMIKEGGYLTPKNLRFLTIHRHGPNLAHGEEILKALEEADLNEAEEADVLRGAQHATIFYMRFLHWIMTGEELKFGTIAAEPVKRAG